MTSILLLVFISCSERSSVITVSIPESDTVKIMRLLLDSAFFRHNLPDISALSRNNPFGDTIIFQSDVDIAKYFPKDLQNIKLKFLTESQICSLATSLYNDSTVFPNFLEIQSFKKVDTTYEVYLRNTCVIPQLNNGKESIYKKLKLEGIDTLPCIFGMMCGGGIGMIFTKNGDTLQSKIIGRWSD